MPTKKDRVTLSISADQSAFINAKFGLESEEERGAEVRRWMKLGWIMTQAGAATWRGERAELARLAFALDDAHFKRLKECARKVVEKKP